MMKRDADESFVPAGDDDSYFKILPITSNPGYGTNTLYVEALATFYPTLTNSLKLAFTRHPGSIIIRDMWMTF